MPCCGNFGAAVEQQFDARKAAQELTKYRGRGPGRTTQLLLEGLAAHDLIGETVLDVGGGVGGLTFELLDRGARTSVIVEASSAYAAAAAEEAARRERAAAVEIVRGDFLDVAPGVGPAALVTLDRVVCCYPDYERLLTESLRRAERGFAYSYPRDRWLVRAATWLENTMRARRVAFRTFVHPVERMQQLIERAGFVLVSRGHTLIWSADVFVRQRTA